MTVHGPTPIAEVVAEIEALADGEVIALAAPYGLPPAERQRTLDDLIERHYGALLDGAGASLADALDALDSERDRATERATEAP